MVDRSKLLDVPERRNVAVSDFEMRKHGDTLFLDGYASVFEHRYDIFGGPPMGWTEVVDRRAFDKTLSEKPDLHLLINHEGMPLARTKSGTLQLSTDSKGLRVKAPDLDRRDPDVQRLEVKMERRDMDEMSFAFRVKSHQWSDDDDERRLLEVSLHKGDVSVVNFGAAGPPASAQMNNIGEILDFLDGVELEPVTAELRAESDALARVARGRDQLAELYRSLAPQRKDRPLSLADARAVVANEKDL